MRNFKKWINVAVFLIICLLFNELCSFLLIPSGYTRVILHTLNEKKENYDCVVLGASHGRSSTDPYILDEKLSVNAINLCIPGENVKDSYYLLKESCRKNKPKMVIFDLDYQYWTGMEQNDFSDAFIYYSMEPSLNKLDYFKNRMLKKDFRVTVARWASYTYMAKEIPHIVKQKLSKEYREYSMEAVTDRDAGGPYKGKGFFKRDPVPIQGGPCPVIWKEKDIFPDAGRYFKKMAEYCKKKDISFVCVTSPVTPSTVKNGEYEKVHKYFERFTKEADVPWYDFNYVRAEKLHRVDEDYTDYDGHMNGAMAERYTDLLGEVLKRHEQGNLEKKEYFYDTFSEVVSSL